MQAKIRRGTTFSAAGAAIDRAHPRRSHWRDLTWKRNATLLTLISKGTREAAEYRFEGGKFVAARVIGGAA